MSSLKKQALHGAIWSFIELVGKRGVQFALYVFLARLLSPKEFGIIAMISIFMSISRSLVDSGFGQALIQKQDATHTDESTVFYFNIFVALVMCVLLCLLAPLISTFYEIPKLTLITRVYSLSMVISSFGIVQNALLVKELQFKKRMYAVFSGTLVSGAVAVYLAFSGFGVWSLVYQAITMQTIYTIVLWFVCSWRPKLEFSFASLRTLGKFGSNMLFSGLLNTIFVKGYSVIIGKLYSAVALGLYETAQQLVNLCVDTLTNVAGQVNFPLLAKLQNDPDRMRMAYRKVLKLTMLIVLPAMVGLGLTADSLVIVVFGEKWAPSIPFVQLLSVVYALYPLHLLNLGLLKSLGRSDLFFRLEIIKKVMTVISILLCFRFGVIGLLYGQIVISIIGLFINTFYIKRLLCAGLWLQIIWIGRVIIITGVMAFAVSLIPLMLKGNTLILLLAQVLIGILVYGGLFALSHDGDVKDLYVMLTEKFRNKRI